MTSFPFTISCYDYLNARHMESKIDIYAGTFKKWADNIIANGVPHNNWNLMQARYVMNIGMMPGKTISNMPMVKDANITLIMCSTVPIIIMESE